ncbi:hypothetical protein MCOR32_001409 [Pyricularia oryzae]|nr:hypothetical protein MCOR01_011663 [Pyricularia oryzae]KAI6385445.1 hypothetical protein MCOR32_001409 [Pyricularia oryzae]KAI6442319.1 hypothetical protein MCOR22_005991 [Pyricularia oryzae]KAI6573953.1 hypothetical protein MCOR09_002545 [Pyricularia oryzae]
MTTTRKVIGPLTPVFTPHPTCSSSLSGFCDNLPPTADETAVGYCQRSMSCSINELQPAEMCAHGEDYRVWHGCLQRGHAAGDVQGRRAWPPTTFLMRCWRA